VTALRFGQFRAPLASLRTAHPALGIGADAVGAPFAAAFGFAPRFVDLLGAAVLATASAPERDGLATRNSASHLARPAFMAAMVFVMPLSVIGPVAFDP
jgi:hypothetical protein